MADSGYYYSKYWQKRKEVNNYDGNLSDLRKILNNLMDTMGDEIRNINNELDDLKSDLNKAIRHDVQFTIRANSLSNEKEKTVTLDSELSVAIAELQEEISRINGLRNTAASDRDNYYSHYTEAKEEEMKDLLEKIF